MQEYLQHMWDQREYIKLTFLCVSSSKCTFYTDQLQLIFADVTNIPVQLWTFWKQEDWPVFRISQYALEAHSGWFTMSHFKL